VRQLTIPADEAYGKQGSPPLIKANTPLMFIIKVEKVDT
jgi:FKBP-type peptidyl-prolyl cis-trans isomerase